MTAGKMKPAVGSAGDDLGAGSAGSSALYHTTPDAARQCPARLLELRERLLALGLTCASDPELRGLIRRAPLGG